MEVLRALYNHEYYKINETAYDNIIADMQNNDLFINGALQAIYDSRSGLLLSKNILGLILNQLDGENRKIFPMRTDNFKENIKTIYNVLIEITMHTSNEFTDGDWYISKPTHLKVILMDSTSITDETKERLVSFIEQKPDLYSYPGGVLFYALKYPVQREKIMVDLIKRGRDSYQDNAIIEYLKLEGSDTKPGVPLVILLDKKFENEDEKLQFYLDYLDLPDADPVTIAVISLSSEKIFKNPSHVIELIQAAANHPKMDVGMLRKMGVNMLSGIAKTKQWFDDLGTWFSGDSL